jgi:hypothetical protein
MMAFFDKHLKPAQASRQVLVSDHARTRSIVAIEWPSGRELWRISNEGGHDVQALRGGGALLTRDRTGAVVEIDGKQKEIWSYGPNTEIKNPVSAERLSNGNTLIADNQLGKVIEVTSEGKIVWTYASPELAKRRIRMARRTPQDTTLICVQVEGRVIEVDRAGKIIWTWQTEKIRKPYLAMRASNGDTLVSLAEPGEVVEVDRAGKIVRSIGGDDRVRFAWASGFTPLPGGGMLICDYLGRRIVEVDAAGKIVHELRNVSYMIASSAIVADTWK